MKDRWLISQLVVREWSRLRTSNTLSPIFQKMDVDVKTRIAFAKEVFNKRKEFLTKGGLSSTLRKRMVKVLVWPVVLYDCDTWTLRGEEINRLEALEMWFWRKLEKIKWKDRISNDEVLSIVGESRCLIRTIGERKDLDRT